MATPEPGAEGGGTSPPTTVEATTPEPAATAPEPVAVEPAAPAAPAATTPEAKPAPTDNASKIDALLDQIGKEPAAPEPKAAAPAAPKPGAAPTPPADPKAIDLTPPEGMNERNSQRWSTLAERAKLVPELETRAATAENAFKSVRDMVAQSTLAQDEFANMLQMGRLYKSENPKDLQAALDQLDGLRAELATRMGVDAPGVDVLAKHPDLKAEVEGMTISRERALEIVKLRNSNATHATQNESQRELQQFQETVKTAAVDMDSTLAARSATPGHEAKVAHIKEYLGDPARMQSFVTTYQPHQWKAAILMMYDTYQPPAAAAPVRAAVQPLRPGHVASGTRLPSGRPVSSHEAVENAWGAAGLA